MGADRVVVHLRRSQANRVATCPTKHSRCGRESMELIQVEGMRQKSAETKLMYPRAPLKGITLGNVSWALVTLQLLGLLQTNLEA